MPNQSKMFGRRASGRVDDDFESCKICDVKSYAKLGHAFPQEGITSEELRENIIYVRNEVVRWYDSIAWVDDASHPSLKRTLTIPDSFDIVTVPHPVEHMTEFLDRLGSCITDKDASCIQVALEAFLNRLSSAGCCIVRDNFIWAEVMFQYCCLFGILHDGIYYSLKDTAQASARAISDTSSTIEEAHYRIRRMGMQAKRSLKVLQLLTGSKPEIPWSEDEIQLELDVLIAQRSEKDTFQAQSLSRSSTAASGPSLVLFDSDSYL